MSGNPLRIAAVFLLCAVALQGYELAKLKEIKATGEQPLQVLILYSNQRTLPANQAFQLGIWTALKEELDARNVELYEEYLEVHRLPFGDENHPMVAYLQKRYHEIAPDVVLIIGPRAMKFSARWGSDIFPNAVQVFAAVREDELARMSSIRPQAGSIYTVTVRPLLEVASRLIPDIREVVLVGGTTDFDGDLLREVRKQLEEGFSWEISEIVGKSPDEIKTELSQLRSDTIVLFTTVFRDSKGAAYLPRNVVQQISEDSPVPVFALFDTMMGSGAVGIGSTSLSEMRQNAASVLEQLIAGKAPEEIGILNNDSTRILFDYRAMKRYGLNPNLLPADAEVFFREPGLIESHPVAIAVGLSTILLQSALIAALLLTYRRKERAEKRTREMENYFSTVFSENPNPTAVIRVRDGTFYDINPAWERLYRTSKEQSIGRSPLDLGILPRDGDAQRYKDFLDVNQEVAGYERQIRTASGDIQNVAFYSKSVTIGDERLHIVTTVDINERVVAERLRNNLARDNRIAQLGQISAWIAHEINQPLGTILNNTEAALIHLDTEADVRKELREIMTEIKSEERRASNVVQHIRGMLGNSTVNKERIPLSELCGEVYIMVAPEAHRRSVTLRMPAKKDGEDCLFGPRVLLHQVFMNLVFNAMDAVAEVPLSQRIVTLDREIFRQDQRVEIRVSDEGPGVPPDKVDSIFELFYTTKEHGMGIGLAISKSVIEDQMGGELKLKQIDGHGARFMITLPLRNDLA